MSLRRCARISSDKCTADKCTARTVISPLLETSLIIPILDSFLYFSQEKAIFCDDFLLRFPAGRAIMETVAQLVYGCFPLLRRTRWAALFYLSITSDIFISPVCIIPSPSVAFHSRLLRQGVLFILMHHQSLPQPPASPRRPFGGAKLYAQTAATHPFPAAAEDGSPEGQVPLALPRVGAARRAGG